MKPKGTVNQHGGRGRVKTAGCDAPMPHHEHVAFALVATAEEPFGPEFLLLQSVTLRTVLQTTSAERAMCVA